MKRKCQDFQGFSVIGGFITRSICIPFYRYLNATVAEPYLCRQLLTRGCFAESNTIFNGQARDGSLDQFEPWHDDLRTPSSLDNEVSRWFNMWSRQSDRADLTDTLMKSLVSTDPDSFPNIRILLVLACTQLATSAEAKHSLFVLRLIKSHLRSWMTDTRLSALTLMKMHYRKHID